MTSANEERIATSQVLIYSSPVLGVFMASMLVSFYLLKFSTDVLLISPAVIGSLLLIARIWDAVTDPAVGWLSDRTHTRIGRRRPWFLGSALPLGCSIVMLWSPPEVLDGGALAAWIGVAIILFYTTYTAFRVPHIAMGAELTRGYHDRTRVFGVMQAVESVGMLAAAGALVVLEDAADPRVMARSMAFGIAVLSFALIVLAALKLKERTEFQGRGGPNPWRSFADVIANPHSRILIGVFFLEQLGFGSMVALLPYLSDYVLNTPGKTGVYLFGAIAPALLAIPIWVHLSKIFGKKSVWLASIAIKTLLFALAFFIQSGDFELMLLIAVGFGLMNGCGSVVGPSLKADVVDWDEAKTGERKEGSYFAAWNFVQKSAGGVAIWAIGMMLAITAFVPNEVQSEETVFGMRMLASVIPCILHVVAVMLMLRFSLSEAEHQKARQEADARLAQ